MSIPVDDLNKGAKAFEGQCCRTKETARSVFRVVYEDSVNSGIRDNVTADRYEPSESGRCVNFYAGGRLIATYFGVIRVCNVGQVQ